MENQTSFDLNGAIEKWRRNLEESSAFRSADLDELETHLRDAVPGLQTAGLSPEEAFLIACRRIGTRSTLETEFRKVNGRAWLNRPWQVGVRFAMAFMLLALFGVGIAIDTATRGAMPGRASHLDAPIWFALPNVFGVILLAMAIFGVIGYAALRVFTKSGSERLADIHTWPQRDNRRR
jgi:hypothetical protein